MVFPSDLPSAPRTIRTKELTDDSVTLEWTAPDRDGGARISGYLVEKREEGKAQWSRVNYVDAQTMTVKARNLLEGRPYELRVMAENSEGLGEPAQVSVTPMKAIGKSMCIIVAEIRKQK